MKYLAPGEKNPWELWKRQAKALASVEKTPELQDKWEAAFFEALENFKFVPGGRIMHGAGREDITTTLNNCYVVGIKDDSIKSIYDCVIQEAMTYKYGGGCGHDLSVLRPGGDEILGTGGNSCGPVGFMNLFSENTNTIAQLSMVEEVQTCKPYVLITLTLRNLLKLKLVMLIWSNIQISRSY